MGCTKRIISGLLIGMKRYWDRWESWTSDCMGVRLFYLEKILKRRKKENHDAIRAENDAINLIMTQSSPILAQYIGN